jgi:hypothetical protein
LAPAILGGEVACDLHEMRDDRSSTKGDPYERNNLWMLESAARFGNEKFDFICFWNGQGVMALAERCTS